MLRILLADDHGIVRSGLRMLIDRHEGMNVVAEAEDGVTAVDAAIREKPDVAILDVAMPRMTGLQAAREIKSHCPDVAVVLLSMYDEEHYLFDALRAGALGYVLKRAADEDLLAAIRSVAAGRPFLPSTTQSALVKEWVAGGEDAPRDPLAWYQRALTDSVENAQKWFRILEGNAQAVTRTAERLSTTAEQTGKGIQESFSEAVTKLKDVYAA